MLQSHWFDALPNAAGFDLIVSNPPYIDADDPHLQQGDVRFEPHSALIAEQQGLADIAHIIEQGRAIYMSTAGYCLNKAGNRRWLSLSY